MASNWKIYHQRGRLVEHARRLARSGRYADHTTIIRELEAMEGFEAARIRLEDRAIRSQLDRLCAMAQARRERPVEAPPHASTRT